MQSPREALNRLALIRSIMFPTGSDGHIPRIMADQRRKTHRKNKLPPLEENMADSAATTTTASGNHHNHHRHQASSTNAVAARINSFYRAPIGEENFQVKHMELKPVAIVKTDESRNNQLVRAPSVDMRAKPLNSRFERKVLFNHERTQRKLSSCSKQASRECSLSSDTVQVAKKTLKDWEIA